MQDNRTPLSTEESNAVLTCLLGALSSEPAVQQQAEATLQGWESRVGFCSCLAEIVANKEADHSSRWLAVVYLKNSISKYWRTRSDQTGMVAEEKGHMRQKLLQLINQEDSQSAVQIAVIFSKIARFDYPREWPSLFSDLLSRLGSGDTLTIRRVYFILHHILKALSSKRLLADQRVFAQVTELLFEHIWGQWVSDSQSIMAALPQALQQPMQAQPVLLHFERWLIMLKILKRLVVFGFQSDARTLQPVQAVSLCAPQLLQGAQALLAARPRPAPRSQLLAMLDRGVLKVVRTMHHMQQAHPWSYHHCGALQPALEFCYSQLVSASGRDGPAQDALQYNCMALLHGVVTCPSYKGNASSAGAGGARDEQQVATIKAMAAQVRATLDQFWSQERLAALAACLVRSFMPLTAAELEELQAAPEQFFSSQHWEEIPRVFAQTLYSCLLSDHREQVAPVVLQMLRQVSDACPAGAPLEQLPGPVVGGVPQLLLLKAAVYSAIAAGSYDLHDYVDFRAWLSSTLLQELQDARPQALLLRAAAANVVGAWIPQLKPEDRPALYRALLALLACGNPFLALSGAAALQLLVADWGFEEAQFADLVAPAMALLSKLLVELDELDAQTQIFNLINVIIEAMAENIRPVAGQIMSLLPHVWQGAEGQSLLRIQVLLAMQRLVHVLGQESPAAWPMLLPMLQHSLDLVHSRAPELLEDGLQLWLVALRNAPSSEPQALQAHPLLQLTPLLTAAMAASTEHILTCTAIISSCVLLGGGVFLQRWGADVVAVVCGYLGNVRERGSLLLLPPLDLVLQAFPQQGPQLLQPALVRLLGLMMGGKETSVVVANALGVFARLLLLNAQQFLAVFGAASAAGVQPPPSSLMQQQQQQQQQQQVLRDASPPEQLLASFMDLWADSFDSIALTSARKLSALAMCCALALPSRVVLLQLGGLLSHVTSAWVETERGLDPADQPFYGFDYFSTSRGEEGGQFDGAAVAAVPSEEAEGECSRRSLVHEADLVTQLRLADLLKEKLAACAAAHGQEFQAAAAGISSAIMGQVQAMVGQL